MKNKSRIPRPIEHAGYRLTYLAARDLWIISKGDGPHLRTALTLSHAHRIAEYEKGVAV